MLDIDIQGKLYRVRSNEPILLDDPQTVWVVLSGSVALFTVTVKDGVIEGSRRYLFSSNPKAALFGTAPSCCQRHCQLLAVPVGETELLKVAPEYFSKLVAFADYKVIDLVEGWLQQLSVLVSQIGQPAVQIRTKGQVQYSLNSGQRLQPESGTSAWIQIQQGTGRLMGFPELTLTPDMGILPLSDSMWLEADGQVQLSTNTTSALRNSNILLKGLSQLHTQLLKCIEILEQQEAQEELQYLRDREHLNRQLTKEAIKELASTLESSEMPFFSEGTSLLAAAGAVGKYLGITIRSPGCFEDLKRFKNPLEAILQASRIRMRRVLLRDNWWWQNCGPLVAYTQESNKPVALLPTTNSRYEIYDPVERKRIPVNARRAAMLAPIAYMFYRPLPNKPLKAWDLLRFVLEGSSKDLPAILLTGTASTLLGMLTPQATAILIDNAIPNSDQGLLLQIGMLLLATAFGMALFQLSQGFALLRVETISVSSTQTAVWDRVLKLPVSFFRQYTTGDLQSRVSSIEAVRQQLSGTILTTLFTSLFALLNLGLLFYYSAKLALVAVAVALMTIVVTTVSGILFVHKIYPLLQQQGKIFGQTVQLINGISKIRVAGAEERAFFIWSKNYSRQVKLDLSSQYVKDGVTLFNTVMPTLASVVLFWFAVELNTPSQTSGDIGLSIGTILAFNSAFTIFIRGTTNLSNTVTDALQVGPLWKRAQPILSAKLEVDLTKVDPGRLKGRIVVDHVTFRYQEEGPLTLDNVSIHAEPGEFIALVGESGSGKSTIFRLLLGFETPESGTIYYDNQDLSKLDVDAVRRQLGVVLQPCRVMSATIFENIASGASITLDEAWEAARMAGLAGDIADMPMAMHTVISEGGSNLSGGQRQRLLIARALVLKPRILLFDEATSALDNKTQAIVSESIDRLQVTRIVVAHRISTIRNAHRIYVLHAGRVVQQGSFEELTSQEGLFVKLIARQLA